MKRKHGWWSFNYTGWHLAMHILVIFILLTFIIGNCLGAMADYVLIVEPDGDAFKAEVVEISTTVRAKTPHKAFDLAAEVVLAYKNNLDIDNQLEALEKQIAILTLEKKRLEAKKAQDEPAIYAILDAEDAARYKQALNVLVETSSWEEHFKLSVSKVFFKRAPEGNPYGLYLIWSWMFGKWQE